MTGQTTFPVEIVYARAEVQALIPLRVEAGTTVAVAIRDSGILERFPEIDLERNKVGVWNRVVMLDTLLAEGDRVEIYRPLVVTPQQARRLRAEAAGRK